MGSLLQSAQLLSSSGMWAWICLQHVGLVSAAWDQTQGPCMAGGFLTMDTREVPGAHGNMHPFPVNKFFLGTGVILGP